MTLVRGPRPGTTGRRASATLALATVLSMLASASASASSSGAEVSPETTRGKGGADLRTRIRDTPDPVSERNNVEYRVRVTNRGPETATNVVLQDTPPEGSTLISAEGRDGFDCGGGEVTLARGSATIECTIGSLPAGDFARASIVVRAPGVSKGGEVVTNSATASADQGDPAPGNNDDVEETTVQPRSPDESAGWISAEGGTITTDVRAPGPDPDDFTVLRMRFGPGPGGEAALRELDCATSSIFSPCIGNIAELLPPEGYERVVGVLLEDGTIDPGSRKRDLEVLYQKRDGDPLVSLERCRRDPALPCIQSIKRLVGDPLTEADDVLRFRVLLDSDPKFAPR